MNGKPLCVLASRDRNIALERLLRSFFWTSTDADVAVYIDDDQEQDYAALMQRLPQVLWHVGPRCGPCRSLNLLVAKHPEYAAYGAATDDSEFLTHGWDRWVVEAIARMPKGIGMIAPKLAGSSRMDFPWASARWIDLVGYLALPLTHHYYWDVALETLAEQTCIVRATKDEFAISHDDAPSENLSIYMQEDALQAIQWIAFERPKLLKKIQEELCS